MISQREHWYIHPTVLSSDMLTCSQIQFMYNHNLLQISGRPNWMTICGGRSAIFIVRGLYVDAK